MNTLDPAKTSILITGATGTIGQSVVHAVRELGLPVAAGVRDLAKAERLFGEGVELRRLDWGDASTFPTALEGIDRVFLLGPPMDPNVDSLLTPFIEELSRQDHIRVTYLSAYGMDKLEGLMGFHARIEDHIRTLPNWTILRAGFLASNFANYFGPDLERGVLALPCGSGETAFIDPQDLGESAARVLAASADHSGQVYTLTGPHSLTFTQIAEFLSELLGHPVHYEPVTPAAFEQTLQSFGLPPVLCQYMSEVYGIIREGRVAEVQPGVKQLLHREPRSLEDYLRENPPRAKA